MTILGLRLDPVCVGLALLGAALLFVLSGQDPYWTDWGQQDAPDVLRLMAGDWSGFVNNATPTYLPSLVARAPFFLAADALGGADDEAFFAAKAGALLLLAGVAAWLLTRARTAGAGLGALLLITLLTSANPIAGRALDYGHAEDLMAACLAILGVLAAGRGRLTLAGVLVALGFVLKQWAILAWLPAMAVAPRRPWQVLVAAVPVAALFFVPLLLRSGVAVESVSSGLQSKATEIWRSHQLFWPLGVDDPNPAASRPKLSPDWFVGFPRMIIVGMSLPLSILWYRRRRAGLSQPYDVLLLLAVLFFGRCLFEPWNIEYYHTPFLLTLVSWEVLRGRGIPILSLVATTATWFSFRVWTEYQTYGDATYVMYMAWTLPLAYVLVRTLLTGELRAPAFLRRPVRATPSAA